MTFNTGTSKAVADQKGFNFDALRDLLILMAVLVVVKQTFIPITFMYAGPISTLTAMIVGTYLLKRRGLGWKDLGFRKPESWLKTLGMTAFAFAILFVVMAAAGWIGGQLFEDIGTSGRFDHLEGDLWAYIGVMVIVWTHTAFFEELLFRAFIINRASTFLGGGLRADIVAVIFSSIFFGYRHYYYQGMNGAVTTGIIGLGFAVLYIWFGRKNILPLVFSHGIINSLSMTFRFLGIKSD